MYRPRTKDGKRQKYQGLDVLDIFHNPSECNKLHPPPFAREAKRYIEFYTARFSRFIKVCKLFSDIKYRKCLRAAVR